MSLPNLVPRADLTGSLGTASKRWENIYAQTLYGDGSNITGVPSNIKTSATDTTGSTYLSDAIVGSSTIAVSKSISGGDETLIVKISDRLYNSFVHGESTGWLSGGRLSIIGGAGVGTEFNVTSGSGQIANNTDLNNPVLTFVTWSAFTSQSVDNIATSDGTFLFIDATGSLVQYAENVADIQHIKRDKILIGGLGHTSNTTIQNVIERPLTLMNPLNQLEDLTYSIGPFSKFGNIVSANGANKSLNKSAGEAFVFGGNAQLEAKDPNSVTTAATTAGLILTATQNEVYAPGTNNTPATTIPTTDYDAGGTPTNIPGTTNWVAARIWHTPKNNLLTYQYAQYYYTSKANALAGFANEGYVLNPSLLITGYVAAIIVHQDGATNLQNTATIIPQGKFAGSGGGGGLSVTTLQNAYNNSTSPEILTDNTRKAITIYGVNAVSRSIEFGVSGSGGPTIKGWINHGGTGSFTMVSASEFIGDGSGLTGVVASAAPGGGNTDIQFNKSGTTSGSINLQYDYTNNIFKVNAGQSSKTTRVTTSTYTVLASDYRIGIAYSLTGSCNIQLPLVSDVPNQEFRFKDEDGNARINRQHILASGSDVIDGAATASMKNNYEAFLVYNNGVNKWFVE